MHKFRLKAQDNNFCESYMCFRWLEIIETKHKVTQTFANMQEQFETCGNFISRFTIINAVITLSWDFHVLNLKKLPIMP